MNTKDHILAALREQFESWERLLSSMSEEEIVAPRFDFDWSIKDVMAHLRFSSDHTLYSTPAPPIPFSVPCKIFR
jgi:hypothetical protein